MNRAKLTWLPSEIMLCGHTWHNFPWPWVSLTWLSYNLQLWHHRHWFPKFSVGFRPIRKELESNVYSFFLLDCIVVEFSSNQYYQTSYLGVISQSEILTIIINSTTRILILKLLFYIKLTQQEMLWEHRLLVIVFTPFLIHPKICFSAPHLLLIWWECNVALWQQILYSLFIPYSWYK